MLHGSMSKTTTRLVLLFILVLTPSLARDACGQHQQHQCEKKRPREEALLQRTMAMSPEGASPERLRAYAAPREDAPILPASERLAQFLRSLLAERMSRQPGGPPLDAASAQTPRNAGSASVGAWWRLLLACGVVVCIPLVIFFLLARPAPPSDADRAQSLKDAELEELKAQEAQLVAKAEDLQKRISRIECGGVETEYEADIDDSTLKQKVDNAAMQAEEDLREQVMNAVHCAAPVVAKVEKVQKCVVGGFHSARTQAEALACEKLLGFLEKVFKALDIDSAPAELVSWLRTLTAGCADGDQQVLVEVLPMPLLLAGLVAPLQLQAVASWSRLHIGFLTALLIIMAGAMTYDIGRPCGNGEVWVWMAGMVAALTLTIFARLAVLSSAAAVLQETKAHVGHSCSRTDGSTWVVSVRQQLLDQSTDFFQALTGYEKIANSAAGRALNFLNLVYIVWGAVGAIWSVRFADEDSVSCKATSVRLVAHIYEFVYVMLLSCTFPALAAWIIGVLINFDAVQKPILKTLQDLDDSASGGVPVTTLIAKTLLFRRVTADIRDTEKHGLEGLIADMTSRKSEMDQRKVSLNAELEAKAAAARAMGELRRQHTETHLTPRAWKPPDLSSFGKGFQAPTFEAPSAGKPNIDVEALKQQGAENARRRVQQTAIQALKSAKQGGADMEKIKQRVKETQASQ